MKKRIKVKARLLSMSVQEPPRATTCVVNDGPDRAWAVLVGMKDGWPAILHTFPVRTSAATTVTPRAKKKARRIR